ncbi:L,D-transpeptidase [Streptomyces sp. NPDC006923]|uniref:L,D-transpeptidase n=1 Tax=Streptomyces sp. NPDC006923 TaxID=3155355 RepID=UPI0033D05931
MSWSSSGIVAGLTAASLAGVGFLGYQAAANIPDTLKPKKPNAGAPAHKQRQNPLALPEKSGTGERVVYAPADRRVWLVEQKPKQQEKVIRTFPVMPSTLSPMPGAYAVTSRTGAVTGSDGVSVEHVVRFTTIENVAIGFSAALDDTMAKPDRTLKTGGVRMKRVDGKAMWKFATVGTRVVVVP